MKQELDCYRLISNSSKIQSAIQEHHYFACFSVSTSFFKGRICLEISNRDLTSLEPRKNLAGDFCKNSSSFSTLD